jgi:hypothetical protein
VRVRPYKPGGRAGAEQVYANLEASRRMSWWAPARPAEQKCAITLSTTGSVQHCVNCGYGPQKTNRMVSSNWRTCNS